MRDVFKWAFCTGLLNGVLLWIREALRDESDKKKRKAFKKAQRKREKQLEEVRRLWVSVGQSFHAEDDRIRQ